MNKRNIPITAVSSKYFCNKNKSGKYSSKPEHSLRSKILQQLDSYHERKEEKSSVRNKISDKTQEKLDYFACNSEKGYFDTNEQLQKCNVCAHVKCTVHVVPQIPTEVTNIRKFRNQNVNEVAEPTCIALSGCNNGEEGVFSINTCRTVTGSDIKDNKVEEGSHLSGSPTKYTDLQKQFLSLKDKHSSVLLLIECGYKYHLFEEDAEIAAGVCHISCYSYHNFKTACFPSQCLNIYIGRLVSQGFKVGVVRQKETAALKSINVSKRTGALFNRELTEIYTKSTLIGEVSENKASSKDYKNHASSGYLISLFEKPASTKQQIVQFGIVAARPTTGDVLYSFFEDGKTRCQLQQFISFLQPDEIIVPESLTADTSILLQHFSKLCEDGIRIEFLKSDWFSFDKAVTDVSLFCSISPSECVNLPAPVICALSALVQYLKDFGLERILKNISSMKTFDASNETFMKFECIAKENLDVFVNHSSRQPEQSLFHLFDKCTTAFGRRMLKDWMNKPLKNARCIVARQNAVEQIIKGSKILTQLKNIMSHMPDLEYYLCATYHLKCSCDQFYTLLKSLNSLKSVVSSILNIEEVSELFSIHPLLQDVAKTLQIIPEYLFSIDEEAARVNNKSKLFSDVSRIPGFCELQLEIDLITNEIMTNQEFVGNLLAIENFSFSTVNNMKFLIEVPQDKEHLVPVQWRKINLTKHLSRYRSPETDSFCRRLSQLEDQRLIVCQEYWIQFLEGFNSNFFVLKDAILLLAKLDCYFSLADFSTLCGYCKPNIIDLGEDVVLDIEGGRHPIIENSLQEDAPYVENDLQLNSKKRCLIITGPNMGGKSAFIKQVGLICLLAQVGSYVPAKSATLTPVDSIFIRLGSEDQIEENRSTYCVEAEETFHILNNVSSKSLVLLDELGNGTSTHDGMAIAFSTLQHLLHEVKCLILFVTHYPPVLKLASMSNSVALNTYMTYAFISNNNESKHKEVQFLYKLTMGTSVGSFGLNVAKLAALPDIVIEKAFKKSTFFEETLKTRSLNRSVFATILDCKDGDYRELISVVRKS